MSRHAASLLVPQEYNLCGDGPTEPKRHCAEGKASLLAEAGKMLEESRLAAAKHEHWTRVLAERQCSRPVLLYTEGYHGYSSAGAMRYF